MSALPCALTGALAADFLAATSAINRKFQALQRLAQLLLEVGSRIPLPNLNALVPVASIDLGAYTSLVQMCPFLNLPALPTTASLAQLQQMVIDAYNRLIQGLLNHPYNRLGLLQAQMNKLVNQLTRPVSTGNQFLDCFLGGCGTTNSTPLTQFNSNFEAANGNVLTPAMQTNLGAVSTLVENLRQLISTVPVTTPIALGFEQQVALPFNHPIPPPPQSPLPG